MATLFAASINLAQHTTVATHAVKEWTFQPTSSPLSNAVQCHGQKIRVTSDFFRFAASIAVPLQPYS